jgi:hypothetical protein
MGTSKTAVFRSPLELFPLAVLKTYQALFLSGTRGGLVAAIKIYGSSFKKGKKSPTFPPGLRLRLREMFYLTFITAS